MSNHNLLRYVTYCGLYCGLCAQRSRIPKHARELQKTLHEEGFDDFYRYAPEIKNAFPPFCSFYKNWQLLIAHAETVKVVLQIAKFDNAPNRGT